MSTGGDDLKIKHSILIVLFALGIMPLIIFSVYMIKSNSNKISRLMEENLKDASVIQIQSINTYFEQRETNLEILSNIDLVKDLIKSEKNGKDLLVTKHYVDDLLEKNANENLHSEGIFIIDKNYNVISSTHSLNAEVINFLKSNEDERKNEDFFISNLIPAERYGNNEKMLIAVKSIEYNGILQGYMIEILNLTFLNSMRESIQLHENGTMYLLDGDEKLVIAGNSRYHTEDFILEKSQKTDFLKKWRAIDITKYPEGILKYEAEGNNYISYYSVNQKNNWKLFLTMNLDQLIEQQNSYTLMIFIVLLVMIAILITSHMMASKKIMRPMEQIIMTLNDIEDKGDYCLRLPEISNNEMGRISSGVNSLLEYIQKNINNEERKQEKLREKADRDPLTWLLNKQKLEQVFREQLECTKAKNGRLAFIFVDIDEFKDFNTNYGHIGGDKILKFISGVLENCTNGHKGRIGGDEFILCIYDEEEINYVNDIALQIITSLNSGCWMAEKSEWVMVGCSIGIAYYPESGDTYEELLKGSDDAMYKVKAKGKNSYCVVTIDEFGKKIYD